MAPDLATKEEMKKAADEAGKAVDDAVKTYADGLTDSKTDADMRKLVAHFNEVRAGYSATVENELIPASHRMDAEAVWAGVLKVKPATEELSATVDKLFDLQKKDAKDLADASRITANHLGKVSLLLLFLGIVLAAGLALVIANLISRPVAKVKTVIDKLAEGDLTHPADIDSKDEIGQMAASLAKAMDRTRTAVSAIAGNSTTLASSSEELSATSAQMGAAAEETSAQAGAVSAAAEQVSANVASVSTGAEEMGASHPRDRQERDRGGPGGRRRGGHGGVDQRHRGQAGRELAPRSARSSRSSPPSPSRPTCWPSTPPSKRPGPARRARASPSSRTRSRSWPRRPRRRPRTSATRSTPSRRDTGAAVSAIGEISAVIAQINDISSTIATAVEEQSATTNEIGRIVTEAATGSGEIAQNITGVASAANDASQGAANTQTAAGELARMAAELSSLVGQFTY